MQVKFRDLNPVFLRYLNRRSYKDLAKLCGVTPRTAQYWKQGMKPNEVHAFVMIMDGSEEGLMWHHIYEAELKDAKKLFNPEKRLRIIEPQN